MKDFFVSYNRADKQWAEWIAWTLEEAGYSVVIQAWDFRPGGNFGLDMQRAAAESQKTIAVLSESYLQSAFTQPEWAAAFANDPQALERKLIPVRVKECKPEGMLRPIVYVDLVGLSEAEATRAVLDAMRDRVKPEQKPVFPGDNAEERSIKAPAPFPETGVVATLPQRLQDLSNLLAPINFEILTNAYRLSLLESRQRQVPETPDTLVQQLEEIPGEIGEVKPLWRFVSFLIQEQSLAPYQRQDLRSWAAKQGIPPLTPVSTLVQRQQEVENCLMVQVQPRSLNDPSLGYLLSAAIVKDPNPSDPEAELIKFPIAIPEAIDSKCAPGYAPEDLPDVLDKLITLCGAEHSIPLSDLTVQWFLPIELLNLPVEHWQIRIGRNQRPCNGQRCRAVIVRSYDRHSLPDYRLVAGDWKKYWTRLSTSLESQCTKVLVALDPVNGKTTIDWNQSEVVGCTFKEHDDRQQQEYFWDDLLSQGLPIALWTRQLGVDQQTAGSVMQAVTQCFITELPTSLGRQRFSALSPQSSEAERLTAAPLCLLWDNPFRPFPTLEYQSA